MMIMKTATTTTMVMIMMIIMTITNTPPQSPSATPHLHHHHHHDHQQKHALSWQGLGDHNFCRNPDGDQRPWCWVERSKFGFCPVPLCSATTSPVTHTPAPALPPDTPNCPAEEFFCAQDNKCLPETFRCDGENDCDNGKDEENCEYNSKKFDEYTDRLPEKPLKNLTFVNTLLERCASYCMSSSFFPCLSFVYNRNQQLCQLLDSRDNATGHLRPADHYSYFLLSPEAGDCTGKFRCHNNRCIGAEELCNGFDDCGDSSDEQGCATQPPPMQVRLVDGDENSGRVEVFYLGIWGTVCDDKWDIRDATVVCRMLGYPGAKRATVIGEFGSGQGNIVLDEVECSGSEQNLQDCPALPWKQHDCQPFEAAGVVCSVNKTCDAKDFTCGSLSDGVSMCVAAKQVCDGVPSCPDSSDEADCQLRIELKNGSSPNEGRVELIRNGLRGTVCDDDWDQEEAAVVCRMLGFRLGGEAVVGGVFGQGTGLIWLDELKCAGLEGSLEDCPHDSWGTNDCSHLEDAGVKCYTRQYPATTTTTTTTPAPESVRVHLVGGSSPNRGRVEVDMGGMRGTVCDDSFDDRDAAVICRMAGFQEGGLAVSSSTYGPGSFLLPILVDELSCNGSEQSLLDCQRLPPGTHDCTHSEDAGVFCLLSGQVSPIRTTLSPFIATTSQPSVSILGDSQCGLRPMELSQRYRRQAEWQRGNEGEEGVEGGEGDLSAPRELSPFRIQKIVGGDMALHGMHPWQAGIQKIYNFYSNGEMLVGHWCGGTILNKHWILSAAHCFRNLPKSHLMVRVGDHGVKVDDEGEQKFLVEELISHPMYNFASHDYDIALLKIKAPDDLGIKFSDHVQPACLPASENDYIPGTECFISGWGETDTENERSSILRSARVPLLSHHVCNYLYKGDLTPRMLCAGYLEGGIDTCQGDSGGPLVCRINSVFAVLGITSWGNGCAKPNAPGIYTKTAKFLSWIQDTIRHHSA